MATIPEENPSVLQGGAFGGGVAGALTAGLTGALIGGVPEAAQAFGAVSGFKQQEQTHRADLMARYADLELKSRDLQQRDMEIEVMQAEQDGKIADARTATERAKNAFNKLPQFIDQDNDKITLDSIMAQRKVNQAGREAVAQFADVVNDEQAHAQAYQEIKALADSAGIPMEQFAPGITEEWRGKETIDAYTANKWVATASQQVLETERAENLKYKMLEERDATQQQYAKDRASQKLVHDMILQQNDFRMRLQLARVKEQGVNIKRSDLSDSSVQELRDELFLQFNAISDYYGSKDKIVELTGILDKAATNIEKAVDTGYISYKEGRLPRPLTQAEAKEQEFRRLWSMTDLDGKTHTTMTSKLREQRQDWIDAWISGAENHPSLGPTFLERYDTRAKREARALEEWNNPSVPRQGTGTIKAKSPAVTAPGL